MILPQANEAARSLDGVAVAGTGASFVESVSSSSFASWFPSPVWWGWGAMSVSGGAALAAIALVALVVSRMAARGGGTRRIALFVRRGATLPAVFAVTVGMFLLASQPLLSRAWPTQAGLLAIVPLAFLALALVASSLHAMQRIPHEGDRCVRCGHPALPSNAVCVECGTARGARVDRGQRLWSGVVAAFGTGAILSSALTAWLAGTPQTYRVEADLRAVADDGSIVLAAVDTSMVVRLSEPVAACVPHRWMRLLAAPANNMDARRIALDISLWWDSEGAATDAAGSGEAGWETGVAEFRAAVAARAVEQGEAATSEGAGRTAESLARLLRARIDARRAVVPQELADALPAEIASLEVTMDRFDPPVWVLLASPLLAAFGTFCGLSVTAVRFLRG